MDACTSPGSVPSDFNCNSSVSCFCRNSNLPLLGTNDPFLEDVGSLKPITDVHGHANDTSNIGNLVHLFEASLRVVDVNRTTSLQLQSQHTNLDQNDMHFIYGDRCEDVKICQLDTCVTSSNKTMEGSGAFSCKHEVILPSRSIVIRENSMTLKSDDCLKQGLISDASSCTTPVPSYKLISAMKGSRVQQGLAPKEKMRVKWAPDVYDPPVTLVSHTVRSSMRRPKIKKDKHRHKHNGGKVSRGSHSGRKQSIRSIAIGDDLRLRLQGPTDRLLLSTSTSSTSKMVDLAVNGNESKCGSSFIDNPFGKVYLPLGKAS